MFEEKAYEEMPPPNTASSAAQFPWAEKYKFFRDGKAGYEVLRE